MNPSRSSIRTDARLDSATRAKVDDLAEHFHLDQSDAQGPVRHLYLYVEAELDEQVQKAAIAAGVKIAPWLRHMVGQITIADFPASWQEARSPERSHDSRASGMRFMLRLDEPSQTKLQQLVTHFSASKAEIIRQLIAQAGPKDFPPHWSTRPVELRGQQVQEKGMRNVQEPRR